MQINISTPLPKQCSAADNWLPHFPNPADFRFNYYQLMDYAQDGLATVPEQAGKNVAVVGAGVAGMTVARELFRCGFNVTIYEASERIGGRLYTHDNPNSTAESKQTAMEMGAMRMPFFALPGDKNCLLEYYILHETGEQHKAVYAQFPNPGSAEGGTGVYLKNGYGPNDDFDKPTMINWPYEGDIDNATLDFLNKKASRFIQFFADNCKTLYTENSERWPQLWRKIVAYYGAMTFDDLVMAPAMNNYVIDNGNLGGFGMDEQEATLLYTIGTGDGSWGAMYSISALWFIRCTMFGFGGENLQTIVGLNDAEQLPHYNQKVNDSSGRDIKPPLYQGIQSIVEYLYFCTAPNQAESLYKSDRSQLYLATSVVKLARKETGEIDVTTSCDNKAHVKTFDHVFVTSAQWATQMSMQITGFDKTLLPSAKVTADHTQHNISSCKLFFPLKTQYWQQTDNNIPQVMATDTYLQDVYSLAWGAECNDKGVILASYTWEDDSLKLLSLSEDKFVELVLLKLAEITQDLNGENTNITDYIDSDCPVTIQWIKQPTYDGCSKLYRQRDENANFIDLSYNQDYAGKSNLYFAGESYSVEGGWTEPALRSALDGVMQLLHHVGAEFKVKNFKFERDYPKWSL